jgi:hypothetical protein
MCKGVFKAWEILERIDWKLGKLLAVEAHSKIVD